MEGQCSVPILIRHTAASAGVFLCLSNKEENNEKDCLCYAFGNGNILLQPVVGSCPEAPRPWRWVPWRSLAWIRPRRGRPSGSLEFSLLLGRPGVVLSVGPLRLSLRLPLRLLSISPGVCSAATSGGCPAGAAGTRLLVLLSGSARLLSVHPKLPGRVDESGSYPHSPQPIEEGIRP